MDVAGFREFFPPLNEDGPPVYLDNACMTLRPNNVIKAVQDYYARNPSCAGRSVHRWGMAISQTVTRTRRKLAEHIGAKNAREVIFTPNATHSINQVAAGMSWNSGDVVITSDREHNSNLVPWLQLSSSGVKLQTVKSHADNQFDLEAFEEVCASAGKSLRMVSLVHVGNLDGVEIPIAEATKIAHDHGAIVHVDGAQSTPHIPIDVETLGCDLFSFSLHKMLGPTGVGALWGREEILSQLEPICAGGGTVEEATAAGYTLRPIPDRLEGGLGHYAGICGTEAALDLLSQYDMRDLASQEIRVNRIMSDGIRHLPGVKIIGPQDAALRGGICSILLDDLDVQNVGILMDEVGGVFVRTGLHCVNQWFDARGIEQGSLRASAYAYNTEEEAHIFVDTFNEIIDGLTGGQS
ncbi:MAG: aminotransferase class V-fold PLP-dependent enzyme [Candidatus Thalassarchaeaceae archaeon]|nr:aminotransferase class V-fold PLP-dependent enzyme [Candidatus Thalassarchaeaceae archaeon]